MQPVVLRIWSSLHRAHTHTRTVDDADCRSTLDETLRRLIAHGQWQRVIELGARHDRCERSRYLWAWPTLAAIGELGRALRAYGCERVLSIGCGAGLLEWLLQQQSAGESMAGGQSCGAIT